MIFGGPVSSPNSPVPSFVHLMPRAQPARPQSAPPSLAASPATFMPLHPAAFRPELFASLSQMSRDPAYNMSQSVVRPSVEKPMPPTPAALPTFAPLARPTAEPAPLLDDVDSTLFGGLSAPTFVFGDSILDGIPLPPAPSDVGFDRVDDLFSSDAYQSSSEDDSVTLDLADLMTEDPLMA
jgi:hypothetical protein